MLQYISAYQVLCAVYYARRQNHKQTDRKPKNLKDKMPNTN